MTLSVERIHILCNGPSISLFKQNDWKNNDLFIGCNFSDPERLNPHFTVIVDIKPLYYLDKLQFPVVLTENAFQHLRRNVPHYDITILDVIPRLKIDSISKKYPMNSGHHACFYGMQKNSDCTEIHIWGADSLWTNSLETTTDRYVKQSMPARREKDNKIISKIWIQHWNYLQSLNSDKAFIFHGKPNDN